MRLFSLTPIKSVAGFSNTQSILFVAASNQYVTLGNNLSFERTDAFSVSFWLKPTTTGIGQAYFGKMKGGSPYTGYNISTTPDSGLRFQLINSYGSNYIEVDCGSILTAGVWKHVCYTYSGNSNASGVNLYINAVSKTLVVNANILSASIITTANLEFGADNPGDIANAGMNQLSVYNRALSSSDVTTIYNGGHPKDLTGFSGLIHWWGLKGPSDTSSTVYDQVGSVNGTLVNGPTYVSDVP